MDDPNITSPSSVAPHFSPEDLALPGPSIGDTDRAASMLRHAGAGELTNRRGPTNSNFPPHQGLHSSHRNPSIQGPPRPSPSPRESSEDGARGTEGEKTGKAHETTHKPPSGTPGSGKRENTQVALRVICLFTACASEQNPISGTAQTEGWVRASHTPLPAAESRPRRTALPKHQERK